MDEIANYSESVFEDIKHVNEYSQEFWCARELQIALEYKQWRRFQNVIEKAKESCINSGNSVEDHFADVGKIVEAGAASKDIGDIQLSRYACYLIVMNGDPRKEVIALGQTYFAVKTRQQELIEDYDNLSEDRKRFGPSAKKWQNITNCLLLQPKMPVLNQTLTMQYSRIMDTKDCMEVLVQRDSCT